MAYEVEQKFHVDDLHATERALRDRGLEISAPVVQDDVYLAHPVRDFSATDEALRLRCDGSANYLTYKGPKIDKTTKTRFELELPLPSGRHVLSQFKELLGILGFDVVIDVHKQRRMTRIEGSVSTIEIVLDEVDGLGTFVELETVAEEPKLEAARQSLALLAAELGLTRNERLSYCELMLNKREQQTGV